MSKNKLLAEAIIVSGYCDIILEILHKHRQLSVNKTLVFSYIIKKNKFNDKEIYSANNSRDILLKCISQLSGSFEDYCNNLEYILKAVHLLIQNKNLLIEGYQLKCNVKDYNSIYRESNFITKSIIESKKITERQFLKEVMHNV